MAFVTPTDVTVGSVLTASKYNQEVVENVSVLPRGLAAYAQATAAQTGITGVVDLTGLTITFTAAGDRYYLIQGFVTANSSVGSDGFGLIIANAADSALAVAHSVSRDNLAGYGLAVFLRVAPSAGSVTYKLRSSRSGSGNLAYQPDATTPSFIMAIDIGPS